MFEKYENYISYVILLSLLIFFTVISLLSEGFYGGSDNIAHYHISHYAFKYPHLFLDHWGKPLFTALSSPFSQFGFHGLKIFNVILGLLISLFSYKIVKAFNYKSPWLIIIFNCFTPLFLIMLFTGLTEILFAFVLIFAVYLTIKEKYIFSALVISLLPLARTEGIIIIPLFLFAYIFYKKYKAIPFLLSGFVIYSIIGFFYYNDFFWLINQNPYSGVKYIYGSGSIFHFIGNYHTIFGRPLTFLLATGIIALIYNLIKKPNLKKTAIKEIRVMAGITPLAAILALKGFGFVFETFRIKKTYLIMISAIIISGIIIRTGILANEIPVKLDKGQLMVKQSCNWLHSSKFYDNNIYYFDPVICYYLELNLN